MTQVMILLAALHGYHSTEAKCNQVSESLISLLSFNLVYGKEYRNRKISEDTNAIKAFNEKCKSKKEK